MPLDTFTRSHLRKALTLKGQWVGLLWNRPMKTRKGIASLITKEVRCVGRIGVAYDNMNAVREAREGGILPPVNAGLPWGRWARYPTLIKHIGKDGVNRLYVRIYPKRPAKTLYRINGQLARREEIEQLCLASEFVESSSPVSCITLTASNLRRVRAGERT